MPCVKTTPLGMPVLPEVKAMAASSSVVVGANWNGPSPSRRSAGRVGPPQNQRRPTVTVRSTVRKALGNSLRSAWASEMPMKAVGSVSATHCKKAVRPIPGSISTGTAPTLASAKVTAMKSTPGRIIISVRSPGLRPISVRPWA